MVTVPYSWLGIGLAFAGILNPFHLLWFMPVAFWLPSFVLSSFWRVFSPLTEYASTVNIFLISSLVLVPALYVVAWYGTPI